MKQRKHWACIKAAFDKAGFHPLRIEDVRALGVPDVNTAHGWIELKQIPHWPKRATSQIPVDLSENQMRFISRRAAAGGGAWVSVAIGETEFLLFDERIIPAQREKSLTREWMEQNCLARGLKGYTNFFAKRQQP